MSIKKLNGKKVAALVDMGFEEIELTEPVKALKEAGATVMIVSPQHKVKAWVHKEWGKEYQADLLLEKADASQFDALLLPGGVMNPDRLRMNEKAVNFVKHFIESGKPVAAICHGPWTLIETKMIQGKRMTCYPSIKTDLKNAGVIWSDEEVVTDSGLVTSRKPDDIPAFNKKMIEEFAEGIHMKRKKENESTTALRPPVKNTGRLNENIDTRNWEEVDNSRDPHDDM
ncbi:MAG: type 1 glutamine amidotransferase [Cytophagaceae bacterium]|nr:type 1 glutamine amidotransferase [Cytophagaceae bacterium]